MLPGDFAPPSSDSPPRPKPWPPSSATSGSTSRRWGAIWAGSGTWCRAISAVPSPAASATAATVAELLAPRLLNTLFLAGFAAIIAVPMSLVLGIVAALYRNGYSIGRSTSPRSSRSRYPSSSSPTSDCFLAVEWPGCYRLAKVGRHAAPRAHLRSALPAMTLTLVGRRPYDAHDPRRHHQSAGQPLHRDGAAQGATPRRIILRHALPNAWRRSSTSSRSTSPI